MVTEDSNPIKVFRPLKGEVAEGRRGFVGDSMVVLDNVSIGYRGHVVATGLSHTFEAGTLTLLTGRNGSGKSTLLRTIAGIQPALNHTKVSLPFTGEVAEGRRGYFSP